MGSIRLRHGQPHDHHATIRTVYTIIFCHVDHRRGPNRTFSPENAADNHGYLQFQDPQFVPRGSQA